MDTKHPLKFFVIGAGAWGTAMAICLARCGQETTLVTRRPEHARNLLTTHENRDYLPGMPLPESLAVIGDLNDGFGEADVALIASPSHALRAWCEQMRMVLHDTSRLQLVLSLVKGFEVGANLRPTEIISQVLRGVNVGALTGPTTASEVARGLPAAMVLATTKMDCFVERVQVAVSSETLRLYLSDDLEGAEYGACLKNIYAIAAGLCDGQRLGDNAKAAMITRALAEMVRVGVALGAQQETFYGLSGFGDLVATSHGDWSRNREFGQKIGEGETIDEILAGRKNVIEGFWTTKAFYELCQMRGIAAPLLAQIHAILYEGKAPVEALYSLMTRELKRETGTPWLQT